MRLKTNIRKLPPANDTRFKLQYEAPYSEALASFIKAKAVKRLSTSRSWNSSLNVFAHYLWTVHKKTVEDIITELKTDEEKNRKSNRVYELLQDFVIWQSEQNKYLEEEKQISPNNIILKTKRAKIFLSVNDITITDDKFNHRVNMPSKEGTSDKEAFDFYIVKKILDTARDPSLYIYLLFLAVTGCRAKEALSLRLADIHFESDPPSVFIRKKNTKTKKNDKQIMITDELVMELRKWLEIKYAPRRIEDTYKNCGMEAPVRDGKILTTFKRKLIPKQNSNDLVFAPLHISGYSASVHSLYYNNRAKFVKVLKLAKLDKFEYGGRRHMFTLHSFRRFVRSQLSDNADFAEYHIGHAGSTYWRKTWAQKRVTFLSFAPLLTFYDAKMIEDKQLEASDQYIQTQERLNQMEYTQKKILAQLEKEDKLIDDKDGAMSSQPTTEFIVDGKKYEMLDRHKARWQNYWNNKNKMQEIITIQEPKVEQVKLEPEIKQVLSSPNLLSDLADMLKDPEKTKILTRIIEELKK